MHPSPSITTSGGASTGLTAHQQAKLAALPLPDQYDDGRPLTARTVSGIPADVVFALNVDNGAATDVSANAHGLTLNSGASISTTEKWAGDSSLYLDGATNAYADNHADFDPAASDFDIRFAGWHQGGAGSPWNAGGADGVSMWGGVGLRAFHFGLRSNGGSTPTLHFSYSTNGTADTQHAVTITDYVNIQEWNHFRAARIGNVFTMFVNETLVYTADFTGVDIFTSTQDLTIGSINDAAIPWEGYIDGVFLQVGGTVDDSIAFRPRRHLFNASEGDVYRPEAPRTTVTIPVFAHDTDVASGDDKQVFVIPETLDGKQLRSVRLSHATASSGASGSCDLQIYNVDQTEDILSTKPVIDADEVDESTGTAAVVDQTKSTATARERWRFDVDTIPTGGTQAKGLSAELKFQ